ncbi:hypothetical protein AMJ80_02385 [bacterium SM23_31]|nr:MAG: hypothetical protein AMJ80_02385 [bacterium SM23_31]
MGDVAGSIRKLQINGINFNVKADADITETGSRYENDTIPTSGPNMRKMTKRAETREGVVITANPAERAQLKQLADDIALVPLSYTLADGTQYRTPSGWIEFENNTTMENSCTVKLFEREQWVQFVA